MYATVLWWEVEARGHFVRVGSLLHHVDPRD